MSTTATSAAVVPWRLRARFAQLLADAKHVGEARAACDGALGGPLNYGAIGEWIAERNAEFDDIGPVVDGGKRHLARRGEVWVTCGEVYNKARFVRKKD